MAKASVAQVTVSGLATNPNPNSLPAGSCAVAENVVSRRPGVLTPMPSTNALLTVPVADHTTGKALWSDADNAVMAATPAASDPNEWVPGTDETQTGWLTCFEVNQEVDAVQKWQLTELPIGEDEDRPAGFLPGLTHTAYSHFRNIITEKWGSVVTSGQGLDYMRWAGLLPPILMSADAVGAGPDWFHDGYSVLYRAHLLLVSTDEDRPFEVIGPVSDVIGTFSASEGAWVNILALIPPNEPNLLSTEQFDIYLNLYRSTQAEVETMQDLPYDFQLVKKVKLTSDIFVPGSRFIFIEDRAKDIARAEGVILYTNGSQSGAEASYYCPPSARDVSVFRDTTFYANRAGFPALKLTVPGAILADDTTGLFSAEDREHGIGIRHISSVTVTSGSADIVVDSAADLVGVVPGQQFVLNDILTTIVAVDVGTLTITISPAPSFSSTTAEIAIWDTYKMRVFYADGTNQDYQGVLASCYLITGFDTLADLCPGFRLFGVPTFGYPLPMYGRELILIHVYPAIKRVLRFEIALTNGQNYSPAYTGDYTTFTEPLESLNDTRPNRLLFSRTGGPEEVPLGNYLDVGAGTILKMAPTQSALLCLCTDGLWRVTGDGTSWQVNQVDPTVTLLHPTCLTTLNNQIYGWVEDGLALIGEDGAQTISTDAVGQDIREWATQIKNWGSPYFWGPSMAGDRFWNEIWLNVYRAYSTGSGGPDHVTTLIYNTDTKNFTRTQRPLLSNVLYSPDANRMISSVFVSGTPNNIALTVQSDFDDPAGDGWLPATVWFNAIQTDDKGKLKQWMDINYFVANVQTLVQVFDADLTSYLKAMFDARNESNDPLASDLTVNIQSMEALSRDIHFWVPRRTALSDQQQFGLSSFLVNEDGEATTATGFYFELQGFTVRYRIASDTLKR
jgi:hypothetical protein